MIRPVPYVDLPGIIYALDRRARMRQRALANFVCWLEPVEHRASLPPILRNIFPLDPVARTWLCEDHWRILGFAQVRERPSRTVWELTYLASMVHSPFASEDVLEALLEYVLEMAAAHAVLRVFARVEEAIPELGLFERYAFQRYARELTYVCGLEPEAAESQRLACEQPAAEKSYEEPALASLRRWSRHDGWGLHQLYRAVTPQRVQMAELLENSEEYARLLVGASRLPLPPARRCETYVCDVGVRLGAWLQLRYGRGTTPHQLSVIVHPEHAELAMPLVRFACRRLLESGLRPIYCQVREYEGAVINALRAGGFEQTTARILLVRHMASLAIKKRVVPAMDKRVIYGVKGLGTVNSRRIMR
jgi:GNAT superfamily N-acetyltransferase